MRLKNTTGKHLLAGPVTIIEAGSYAGDAQINDVPPGQRRLLSYGIDLKVNVQVTDDPQQSSIQLARLVKGVLQLQWKEITRTTYLFDNKGETAKTLVLEQARQQPWTLVNPAKPDEITDSLYRFVRRIPANTVLKMPVVQEWNRPEVVELLPLEPDRIELYARLANLPENVKDSLSKVIDAKRALASTRQQIDQHRQQIADITNEQARIRENMKAVATSTDYYGRLIQKLDQQETQIESLQKESAALQKQIDSQQAALEKLIAGLTL